MRHYTLDGRTPRPCGLDEYMRWREHNDSSVARDYIGEVLVSTVFLGYDQQLFDTGPPLLFETRLFNGGPVDNEGRRCTTYEEAEAQHREACAAVLAQNIK